MHAMKLGKQAIDLIRQGGIRPRFAAVVSRGLFRLMRGR